MRKLGGERESKVIWHSTFVLLTSESLGPNKVPGIKQAMIMYIEISE